MAAARDQAARTLRSEADSAGDEVAHKASAEIADSLGAHLSDETSRRPHETPDRPVIAKPVPETAAAPVAKSGNRKKMVFFGAIALLALAAASYGVHWFLVGRLHVSADDAHVLVNS